MRYRDDRWCAVGSDAGWVPHGQFRGTRGQQTLEGQFRQGRVDGRWTLSDADGTALQTGAFAPCGRAEPKQRPVAWPAPRLSERLWRSALPGESCRTGRWEVGGRNRGETPYCSAEFVAGRPDGVWSCRAGRAEMSRPVLTLEFRGGVREGRWAAMREPWRAECLFGAVEFVGGVPRGTSEFTDSECRVVRRVRFEGGGAEVWRQWSWERGEWEPSAETGLPAQYWEPGSESQLLAMVEQGPRALALAASLRLLSNPPPSPSQVHRIRRAHRRWSKVADMRCKMVATEQRCLRTHLGVSTLLELLLTRMGLESFRMSTVELALAKPKASDRIRTMPHRAWGSEVSEFSIDFSALAVAVLIETGGLSGSETFTARALGLLTPEYRRPLGALEVHRVESLHALLPVPEPARLRWVGPGLLDSEQAVVTRGWIRGNLAGLAWDEAGQYRQAEAEPRGATAH